MNHYSYETTDTLCEKLWELDILPEEAVLESNSNLKWNESAGVFTNSEHFKILDNEMNVLYEFTDHMAKIIFYLDSEPIAVLSDHHTVSFIHLETFELLNQYSVLHIDAFDIQLEKDEFGLYLFDEDSLIIHNFSGMTWESSDTIPFNTDEKNGNYLYNNNFKNICYRNDTSIVVIDLNNDLIVSKPIINKIKDLKFINNGTQLLMIKSEGKFKSIELLSYPELNTINIIETDFTHVDLVEGDQYLGFFDRKKGAIGIDYKGREIFRSAKEGYKGLGFYNDKIVTVIKDGPMLNVFYNNLETKEAELIKRFQGNRIFILGFADEDNSLVYKFGDQLFYYSFAENKINEVLNFEKNSLYKTSLDPFSNRISYQESRTSFVVHDLESGEKKFLDSPKGYPVFTVKKDTMVVVEENLIYKLSINTTKIDTISIAESGKPDVGWEGNFNIRTSKHPTKNAIYYTLGGQLQLLDLGNLTIEEIDTGSRIKFLGSMNDSLIYILDNVGIQLLNKNSGKRRLLKRGEFYAEIITFQKYKDEGIGLFGLTQILLFDPLKKNSYQYMGYRPSHALSLDKQYFVSSTGDKLFLYKLRN